MPNSVLISIKPKYVNKIIDGKKQFEFRKAIFQSPNVKKVYIYASSPIKKIIGYFHLGDIIEGRPSEIWEKCSSMGGISEQEFFKYYEGKTKAFSLPIERLKVFDHVICPYSTFDNFTPPQSFMYFDQMEPKI